MTVPTEQQVLTAMGDEGIDQGVTAVADLLIALGYHDVARELQRRCDAIAFVEDERVF